MTYDPYFSIEFGKSRAHLALTPLLSDSNYPNIRFRVPDPSLVLTKYNRRTHNVPDLVDIQPQQTFITAILNNFYLKKAWDKIFFFPSERHIIFFYDDLA